MAENSKIEWTDHTFNPWIGCQKVSPGCDHCYAEAMMDHRYGKVQWGPHGERKRTSDANWRLPRRWARTANGRRPRVFCASLADVFDNQAPEEWRLDLWALIRSTPELDWLLLTKRPENMRKMLPWAPVGGTPYRNVWLGITCEDQEHYDRRWPMLANIPATIRFISYEPALGPLDPHGVMTPTAFRTPDWLICGGESGPHARLMNPDWARSARDLCEVNCTAFFMKQMTSKKTIPPDLMVREFPQLLTSAKDR